jgi:hypothetical protein
MQKNIIMKKITTLLVIFAFVLSVGPLPAAQAAMVTTQDVVAESTAVQDLEKIQSFLSRDDVQRQMQSLGVDAEEAKLRVASLSDEELSRIAGHIGEDPAGQGAVGAIIGAAVLIFIILLITDILGLTDVFPFVRAR